jgi:xanthine/uracil permease
MNKMGAPEAMAETMTSAAIAFDVGIDDRLPIGETLALAVQNISVMATMTIFPGLLGRAFHMGLDQIAYLYGICFMVCGLTTIFQSVGLLRLPIVQGPWAPTFAALMVLGHLPGSDLGTAFGSFFVAAIIWVFCSIPVRGISVISLIAGYLKGGVVSGVIIVLSMIQLASATVPHWLGTANMPGFPVLNIVCGLVGIVMFMIFTLKGNILLRRGAVLIALAAGSALYFAFQAPHFQLFDGSPFFIVPTLFPFGFGTKPVFIVIFFLTLLPAGVQSIALYGLVGSWIGEALTVGRICQGVFAMAGGAVLGATFGSFSTVCYETNLSLLQSTKVASRYVTFTTGLMLVVLGGFAKIDMLFAAIPGPVMSAISTVLFGIVLVHGAKLIVSEQLNDCKFMIVGLSLFLGLGGLFVSPATLSGLPILVQTIIDQPVILGGTTVAVLYALLCGDRRTA